MSCHDCQQPFEQSKKMRVCLAFCKSCRKNHSKDLLEFISNPHSSTVFTESQTDDAESLLRRQKADIRLDLHDTLDTISVYQKLSENHIACCVSYVGQLTETRLEARRDIQARIASGQIRFGALVFNRGPRRDPELANNFQAVGSKSWFNKLLVSESDAIFVDDSEDHVSSVEAGGTTSYLIVGGQDLLKIIEQHYAVYSSDDDLFE